MLLPAQVTTSSWMWIFFLLLLVSIPVSVGVVALVFARHTRGARQNLESRTASLPPAVRAELKAATWRRVLLVMAICLAVVVLTWKFRNLSPSMLNSIALGCVLVVLLSVFWSLPGRVGLGPVRIDLGPNEFVPGAAGGTQRRARWIWLLACVLVVVLQALARNVTVMMIWLSIGIMPALMLLASDNVRLHEHGLSYLTMALPWRRVKAWAWSEDGRCLALKRPGFLGLGTWSIVPVPEGRRDEVDALLRERLPVSAIA